MNVGIIGYGAIGRTVHHALATTPHTVVGILTRSEPRKADDVVDAAPFLRDLPALLRLAPRVIVECAGHGALRTHGAAILSAGIDLVVASVGALADAALESSLRTAAIGGGRLIIPSGALGGLDALGAARLAGLDEVAYTSRKAPTAWSGTKAESLIDLSRVKAASTFFEGSARQAALEFPLNANVVAAVALAGIGFDRTRVKLMVDPDATGNRHIIEARGAFGEISATVLARTLPDNPKTSMLAPFSLVRAIANSAEPVLI